MAILPLSHSKTPPRLSAVREKGSASEMTGHNLGLGAAEAKEEEYVKSLTAGEMLCFFYMMLVVTIGLSTFGRPSYGIPTPTLDVFLAVHFTAISIEMQTILAILLSSKPSPSPIPSPLNEWFMGITAWLFLVAYFLNYASVSLNAPEPSYVDLILAAVASAVNLAITVYSMLTRRVEV